MAGVELERKQWARRQYQAPVAADAQDEFPLYPGMIEAPGEEGTAMVDSRLRPIERRILDLSHTGSSDADIATRFRRSPGYVRRVRELAGLHGRGETEYGGAALRPLERRVLTLRRQGASYADIASRFRRSPSFIERVERIANDKAREA